MNWQFKCFRNMVILVIIWFLLNSVLQHHILIAFVPSSSMEKTICKGDIIIGRRMPVGVKRKDIILFAHNGRLLIKRVIGLPGDQIMIEDDVVSINGKELKEPYIKEDIKEPSSKSYKVPENSYFVLGDNRNYSTDSRKWKDPYVKDKAVLAKCFIGIRISTLKIFLP